jgi:hypothetical protein
MSFEIPPIMPSQVFLLNLVPAVPAASRFWVRISFILERSSKSPLALMIVSEPLAKHKATNISFIVCALSSGVCCWEVAGAAASTSVSPKKATRGRRIHMEAYGLIDALPNYHISGKVRHQRLVAAWSGSVPG